MRPLLVALSLIACAAHEPAPRPRAPDTPPARPPEPPMGPEPAPLLAPEPVVVAEVETRGAATLPPYERGKQDALAAIERDELEIETFGHPARCRSAYAQILADTYKVRLREVAGCIVDSTILEHARGYNEVMQAEIERRYGADTFKKAAAAAGC